MSHPLSIRSGLGALILERIAVDYRFSGHWLIEWPPSGLAKHIPVAGLGGRPVLDYDSGKKSTDLLKNAQEEVQDRIRGLPVCSFALLCFLLVLCNRFCI